MGSGPIDLRVAVTQSNIQFHIDALALGQGVGGVGWRRIGEVRLGGRGEGKVE